MSELTEGWGYFTDEFHYFVEKPPGIPDSLCGSASMRKEYLVKEKPKIAECCPECVDLFWKRISTRWDKVTEAEEALSEESYVNNPEQVNHPQHYGGVDNPYEAIKVIEAWGLGFHLGNVVKYVARAGKKGDASECLEKAKWYLERYMELHSKCE